MITKNIIPIVLFMIMLSLLPVARSYSGTPISYKKNPSLYKEQLKNKCFVGRLDTKTYYLYFSSISDSNEGYYWSRDTSTVKRLTTSLLDDTTIQVILFNEHASQEGVLFGHLRKLQHTDAAIADADSIGFYGKVLFGNKTYDSVALVGFLYEPAQNKTIQNKTLSNSFRKGKIFSLISYPAIFGPSTDWGDLDLNGGFKDYFLNFQGSFVSNNYPKVADSNQSNESLYIDYLPTAFTDRFFSLYIKVQTLRDKPLRLAEFYYSLNMDLQRQVDLQLLDLFNDTTTYVDSLIYHINNYLKEAKSELRVTAKFEFSYKWSLDKTGLIIVIKDTINDNRILSNTFVVARLPYRKIKHLLKMDMINDYIRTSD
jgi:hypothetical protein